MIKRIRQTINGNKGRKRMNPIQVVLKWATHKNFATEFRRASWDSDST